MEAKWRFGGMVERELGGRWAKWRFGGMVERELVDDGPSGTLDASTRSRGTSLNGKGQSNGGSGRPNTG
jgi:hypothetical protein